MDDSVKLGLSLGLMPNPWVVDSLEEFLFFCCPECPDRSASKESFVNHALRSHPQSRDALLYVESSSNLNVKLEEEWGPPEDEDCGNTSSLVFRGLKNLSQDTASVTSEQTGHE
jgi:hypothetical protein